MKKNNTFIVSVAGAAIGIAALVGSFFVLSFPAARATAIISGNLQLTSANESMSQDLLAGTGTANISVGLQSLNGMNANGVTVHVQLLQGNGLVQEAVYPADILHEAPSLFWLTPTNVPAGTYTLAVMVYNADGSLNASFPSIASVTLSASGSASGAGGNGGSNNTGGTGNGTGTATSTVGTAPVQGTVAIVSVDRIKENLTAGTPTTITANLISANGANTNGVTVHVQLVKNGAIADEAIYPAVDIFHEYPQGFALTTRTDLAPGDYTIAVTVNNADGTMNSFFPSLGTLTIVSAGAGAGGGTGTGTSTATSTASTNSFSAQILNGLFDRSSFKVFVANADPTVFDGADMKIDLVDPATNRVVDTEIEPANVYTIPNPSASITPPFAEMDWFYDPYSCTGHVPAGAYDVAVSLVAHTSRTVLASFPNLGTETFTFAPSAYCAAPETIPSAP